MPFTVYFTELHDFIVYISYVCANMYLSQEITGVFMINCVLSYSLYKDIFPIWAIGEYRKHIQLT